MLRSGIFGHPRSQGLFPSQGKGPGNEVGSLTFCSQETLVPTPGGVLRSAVNNLFIPYPIKLRERLKETSKQRFSVKLFCKMGLTVKIKLIRVLSFVQCWIALWLIVLGIVERARIDWRLSGLGMPIWTGIWVRIY